ncbi:uncharacterized protein LOC108025850 isoform X2 [Drosophila biarmipes]|uniref:uncharacterized protein LOC108025850 isoform X2 n=1 Tax=Drosophila biarmipes TaxID=125945 RepID=UPI0007E785AC|nr:uncharacterized protein LOC108025850 isoform X2 [Drosophila biarmipes]
MSGNPDRSLADLFMDWRLGDENEDPAAAGCDPAVSPASTTRSQLVHLKSPCKVPQTEITETHTEPNDSVIFVDADISSSSSNSNSSVILVSSGVSNESLVSCLHSSQYHSTSENVTIEETTDCEFGHLSLDSDTNRPGAADMDAPKFSLKRHSPDPADHDLEIKKFHRNLDEVATPSNRSVVTRSGRAVVTRMNHAFDYSSSQSKDDGEEDSDDQWLDTDDEEYQQALEFVQPKWHGCKRRSLGNSSSSACSTDDSQSSPVAASSIVYLELGEQVAVVRDEPKANIALEDDGELKTQMHKFLGLMAARRRLYNPATDHDPEEPQESVDNLSISRLLDSSRSSATGLVTPSPKRLTQSPRTPTPTWSSLNLSHRRRPTQEERQTKMFDDMVLQANANSYEEQTPDALKEPIDLSELPSRKQVALICRRHKSSIACLEQHPLFYRFVESLNPRTSINMCHPLALSYREKSFNDCKVALSKVLFNMFNHAIFHCGLMAPIVWKRGMTTHCKSELQVAASGRRTARILLWENISQPGMLIQPLLHEMCHAAAFVFNRETGHGDNCRRWVYQAKSAMPELPTVEDCQATFKYTCTMCCRCSYGRIEFELDRVRCHYCQFEVAVKPCRKDEICHGTRPDFTITPFKSFVRENYLKLGEEGGSTHSSRMRLLNEEYKKMNAPTG